MRRVVYVCCTAWLLLAAVAAQAASRPKLIVLIVAEQFRPDYLDRYRPEFSAGGFNRLLKGGAVFPRCRYEYLSTFPASGAAVLATGAYPDHHGIVGEYWYDLQEHRLARAAEDPEYGSSPRNLVGTTLADELRRATGGRSQIISVSLRDQTAVMLGGHRPDGCYWLDSTGRYATSRYYADGLPAWVTSFQENHAAQRWKGQAWKALGAGEPAPPLRTLDGAPAAYLANYLASPFALDDEFDFARAAIENEQLGRGSSPDLLAVSLSSLYYLGLDSGAGSPLMRDMVVRLDRKIEELLTWLDGRFGADNFWLVFTATQGLADSPETIQDEGIAGGRVAGDQIADTVNARLSAIFGRNSYVEKYVYPSLYLRRSTLDQLRTRLADAAGIAGQATAIRAETARLAGEAALTVPGVAGYAVPNGPTAFPAPESARMLDRCLFPSRSGDLLIAYQPYYMELYGDGHGIAPGSFYSYDTFVPLLFYGPAFRAQTFERTVSPTSLAATLAAALDISPPSSATGEPLADALK